ncbi:hypothetical protein HanHA89_Chr04g0127591 [Helianthus annuus]|nr:hypothetical protein HanHA89_Chr04g0127591 [Helianthus annuus]
MQEIEQTRWKKTSVAPRDRDPSTRHDTRRPSRPEKAGVFSVAARDNLPVLEKFVLDMF